MSSYPVDLVVTSPPRFERVQLALRLAIALVLGFVGISGGWLTLVLYFALPVIAAVAISTRGSAAYLGGAGPQTWRAVRWFLDLSAYMMLLVDRFPVAEDGTCRVELRVTGEPTVGRALLRLVTSIPAALVLCVLWMIAGVLIVIGAITILVTETVPEGILRYQHAVLRGQARLFAYHASLVAQHPPFALDAAGGASAGASPRMQGGRP